jgi:type I restriction enzyme S subunit
MAEFPVTTLGEVASVRSGFAFKSSDWKESGIPVVKIANVKSGRLSMDGCSFVDDDIAKDAHEFQLEPGDILIAMTGYIGEVAVVRETDLPALLNQRVGRFSIRDPRRLDREFLYYVVTAPSIRREIEGLGYGSAQPNVSPSLIQGVSVPLPPIAYQRAIASTLGALDSKIDLNRRMNETLEAMARAIFKDWFVDFGPTRAKIEGRAPYLAPDIWSLFPNRFDDDGRPEGWGERRVEDILELAYGKALKASDRTDGPIPVYGSGGITGYHNEALVEGPSVIVGRKGTVGALYWEDRPFFPIDTVFYVRPKAHLTFCYYHLQTLGLETMNTDAAVPGLNRNNVYRLSVPWSDDKLRMQFDQLSAPLRQRIRANSDEIETLSNTRNFLLPKLMSGEVRVKEAEKLIGEVA